MDENAKDVVVIGGGPAGYVAAIRSAQAGAKTALVEQKKIGGTCLNVGCISTKTLAKTAEIYAQTLNLASFGIKNGNVTLDYPLVQQRKEQVVENLTSGVSVLLEANGVETYFGEASFITSDTLKIGSEDGGEHRLSFKKAIIATGSRSTQLPGFSFDENFVLDSTALLALDKLPQSLLVIGGGVIGTEFASIMNQFGVKVYLVEMLPNLIPTMDTEITETLREELLEKGIEVLTSTTLQKYDIKNNVVEVDLKIGEETRSVKVEKMLVAVGRTPNIDNLNLEKIGVEVENHTIKVNSYLETNVAGIFAAGDVCGGIQLASTAYHEGEVAAANCQGANIEASDCLTPYCVFTHPEVAGVGISEQKARELYEDVIVERFPFSANGKALAAGNEKGFVKMIVEPKYHEILGFFIIGSTATELIHQASQIMKFEGTVDDLASLIYGHPTLSEAVNEVALMGIKKPLHMV